MQPKSRDEKALPGGAADRPAGLARLLLGCGPVRFWIANAAAWAALAAAIVFDAATSRLLDDLSGGAVAARAVVSAESRHGAVAVFRLAALATAVATAVVSGAALTFGVLLGPPRHRRLQSWLVAMTLACCWLALFVSWRDAAWFGRRLRTAALIEQVAPIAARLNAEWPRQDGELPQIGPFMAYPARAPATLILLTPPQLEGQAAAINLIERTADGALHFGLGGTETGAWLIWRPAGGAPESFQGGLERRYELDRRQRLADKWWLATYRDPIDAGRLNAGE